jgi:CDP-diacylglycerol---glycerol-3-phosphate 3-phosphatidyltransferase
MRNLPNRLTWLRVLLAPLLVVAWYWGGDGTRWPAVVVFVVAGLTDWLDGWLARRLGETSHFGAFLDPVADKLMVTTALVLILERHGGPWLAVPTALIVTREIAVSALREWAARQGVSGSVPVSWLGKLKTTVQMLAILLLLVGGEAAGVDVHSAGLVVLVAAALLSVWSLLEYFQLARRLIAESA